MHVLVWFLIVPVVAMDLLTAYWPVSDVPSINQIGDIGFICAVVVTTVIGFWGLACVLLVGRRMVINRAGRSRTSFRLVRTESARLILPLFFTSLLRSIVTFEWALIAIIPASLFLMGSQACRATLSPLLSATGTFFSNGSLDPLQQVQASFFLKCGPALLFLPLLLPAIIYQIRSAFFGVVLVADDLSYRDALRKSRSVVLGRTWLVLGVIVALSVLIFLPATILSALFAALQSAAVPDLPVFALIIEDSIFAFASLLFTLSLVAFYGRLLKAKKDGPTEVMPDALS